MTAMTGELGILSQGQRFYTVAEVAAITRLSKMTIYRLVHEGAVDCRRIGRSLRVPADAVHKLITRGTP